MKAQALSHTARLKLKLAGVEATPTVNALSAAFQAACIAVENKTRNEVGVTGGLLGAINTQIPEFALAFGSRQSPGCSWVEYQVKDGVNEPMTGADFGLVIRLNPLKARIGIFQAKVDRAAKPSHLKPHHMSVELSDLPSEPQFERLKRFGFQVLSKVTTPYRDLVELGWVHYVIYGPGVCNAYPLSQMSSIDEEYGRRKDAQEEIDRANSIKLIELKGRTLRDLLREGAESPQIVAADGWLDTTADIAKAAILDGAYAMPFYVGSPHQMPELLNEDELKHHGITRTNKVDSTPEGGENRMASPGQSGPQNRKGPSP
ncbi:MAG: hypothetical protein ACTHOL_18500 [Luteibacter jiangsuensis]